MFRKMGMVLAGLVVAGFLPAAPLPPEVPIGDSLERVSTRRLLADLESTEGRIRMTATRELLRRSDRIVPDLKGAGARDLYGTLFARQPTRKDMLYSVLIAKDQLRAPNFRRSAFRLIVEEGVTDQEIQGMASRYGFSAEKLYRADDMPAKTRVCECAIEKPDLVRLEFVMRELLLNERRVVTTALAYRW